MNVQRNCVINIKEMGSLQAGLYRLLDIYPEYRQICLFFIGDSGGATKPILVSFSDYREATAKGRIEEYFYALPPEILYEEEEISKSMKAQRDDSYEKIKNLVRNEEFLHKFASSGRSTLVVEHAEKLNIRPLVIYRLLRKYWKYGQVKNALLKLTNNCGGRGKEKSASSKQRGRPIDQGKYNLRTRRSINIGVEEKEQIKDAVQKNLKLGKRFRYSKAYDTYKRLYCLQELEHAVESGRSAQIATENQFRYWAKKFFPKEKILKAILSESEFSKDYTGSLSSVSAHTTSPGRRYEIDSTTADVYLVSEYNRQFIIGRPTLYSITDVASRMIAGIHISLEFASWVSARQALYNATMSKVDYCSRYGLNIKDSDWPCLGLPTAIFCDRAEMLGEKAESLVDGLGTILEIAPPYRGDAKSIVERRFGIYNEDIHELPATTHGDIRQRGQKDPRLDAALTLPAFSKILLELVIEHNTYRQFDDLVTPELIENNVDPTPLNYWNYYTSKMQHGLISVSKNLFKAKLMKKGVASSTERGIVHGDLRYTCNLAKQEDWATKALNRGSWKMECRSDESWSNSIFIRPTNSSEYIECTLCDAEKNYKAKHLADVIYAKEWAKAKSEKSDYDYAKAKRFNKVELIVRSEIEATKNATTNMSNNSRIKNIRENRQDYLQIKKYRDSCDLMDTPIKAENTISDTKKTSKNRNRILDLMKSIADENE